MEKETLIFDEIGIRIKLPFEDAGGKEQRETLILEKCGCSKEGLTAADYERKAKSQIKASYIQLNSEQRLLQKMSEKITENGGDILEIGFGLGFAADAIHIASRINSHTIIEEHPVLYERALEWAKDKPSVTVINGNWLDLLPTLSQTFDGILQNVRIDKNLRFFLSNVEVICKEGTLISFFISPGNDSILNYENFQFTDEELTKSPYFGGSGWNWSWTTFNGTEFTK